MRETFHGTLQATYQPVLVEMKGSFVVDEAPTRPCVQNQSFVCSPFLGGVQWSTLRQHVHRVCHGNVTLNVRNDLILQASVSQTPPCCPYVYAKASPSMSPRLPIKQSQHCHNIRSPPCTHLASAATSSDPQRSCRCVADCSLCPAWRTACANLGW